MMLRDLESDLSGPATCAGDDGPALTPRAIRRIGAQALAEVYARCARTGAGEHETIDVRVAAAAARRDPPYVFGDPLELDVVRTLLNAGRARGAADPGDGAEPCRPSRASTTSSARDGLRHPARPRCCCST